MNHDHDPLWNPAVTGDADMRRMEALLGTFGAGARGLVEQMPTRPTASPDGDDGRMPPIRYAPPGIVRPVGRPHPRARWLRSVRGAAAVLAAIGLLLAAGLAYRLSWRDGQPWQVTAARVDEKTPTRWLVPGESLQSGVGETVDIDVARIGRIALSPESRMRLIETRAGRHRVELDRGHLRARIWAPPDYFAVSSSGAEIVDLGCDFELWKQPDGRGRVLVRSGWVAYRVGERDLLVPAGFELNFEGAHARTPVRAVADPTFVAAVIELEQALARSGPASADTRTASAVVAAAAADADGYTLLSLLTQEPRLASSALYPRLARALGEDTGDEPHRAAWLAGEAVAIDAWWDRLEVQPKTWWANWADAFS